MNDMPDEPFERQVADVTRRTVGPPRHVDALAIAHGAATTERRGRRWFYGAMQFVAGGAVVAVFAAIVLWSGVLTGDGDQDPAPVGSSPSAAPSASVDPTMPPEELTYASGRFDAMFESTLFQDTPGGSADLAGPSWFEVTSTDPRLEGEATYLEHIAEWGSEPWLFLAEGQLEIRNDEGAWTGTAGPFLTMGPASAWEAPADPPQGPSDPPQGPSDQIASAGPVILEGSGAYTGYTALIDRAPDEDSEEAQLGTAGFGSGTFEALIVNRTWPGVPSEDVWLREMRRTGQDP